ncbi:hypothetical protein CCMA1212_008015 [Trichoderma ghanense]|uniref:Uncharacterized protein n=1 Tax=Trichoderma ghanense TaxID=65468 RepID=A0ABY2GVX8_9HYPO
MAVRPVSPLIVLKGLLLQKSLPSQQSMKLFAMASAMSERAKCAFFKEEVVLDAGGGGAGGEVDRVGGLDEDAVVDGAGGEGVLLEGDGEGLEVG